MPHSVHASSSPSVSDSDLPDAPSGSSTARDQSARNGSPDASTVIPTFAAPTPDSSDMFDEEDEDDEFSSSGAAASEAPRPLPGNGIDYISPDVLRAFYQRLFPYRYIFQWLNHSHQPTNDFAHREFAFTLPGDVYARYQSFQTADLFRKSLISSLPTRFEVGPIYNTNPRDRKTLRPGASFKPLQKELVLDIDMSDYDAIRTCCTGASICKKCWSWMRAAIKVLDKSLREDFGWRHILWVYSGRRGVHAWVCDKNAREMDDRTRTAVANYLEVLKGGDGKAKKVALRRPLHPHLDRSLKILRETFQSDILKGQDPWRMEERAQHLLDLLPDATLNHALQQKWKSEPGLCSRDKWADIDELAADSTYHSKTFDSKRLLEAKQDVVFEYTYPRLDAAVSKHLNHLLKSPFCVHPKSGRVCVPISPDEWDRFDPENVPKVTELLDEIDEWAAQNQQTTMETKEANRKLPDWEKTRLKPYIEFFRSFASDLIKDEQKSAPKRKADETRRMDF